MAAIGLKERVIVFSTLVLVLFGALVLASVELVSAEQSLKKDFSKDELISNQEVDLNYFTKVGRLLRQRGQSGHHHVWPEMRFGWRIIVGTVIGFLGAAFGSVGGVGGGGIFVPMLTLVIGFDPKSSTAMSKCMITGAAIATVYYNIKKRHPSLDLPIIDYDLALLFQPMLMLGISVGVAFNVIFADWMVTVLLIILFLGLSTKAFLKGVETWKKETILQKEVALRLETKGNNGEEMDLKTIPVDPSNGNQMEAKENKKPGVSIIENVHWKELGILVAVWIIVLALQIAKNHTATCSLAYWALNLLQIPVTVGASAYEAIGLSKGRRAIASKGENAGANWRVHQFVLYFSLGIVAGIVGGLLGLGGGFIMGPLFLELGIPPQVSSATATFIMMFSSSMSVVEYYLLNRFPVPYALYLAAVATIAAFVGQYVVRRVIAVLGRASLIIFILALTIFVSAISLGGVGISNMVKKIEGKEYIGFNSICAYEA